MNNPIDAVMKAAENIKNQTNESKQPEVDNVEDTSPIELTKNESVLDREVQETTKSNDAPSKTTSSIGKKVIIAVVLVVWVIGVKFYVFDSANNEIADAPETVDKHPASASELVAPEITTAKPHSVEIVPLEGSLEDADQTNSVLSMNDDFTIADTASIPNTLVNDTVTADAASKIIDIKDKESTISQDLLTMKTIDTAAPPTISKNNQRTEMLVLSDQDDIDTGLAQTVTNHTNAHSVLDSLNIAASTNEKEQSANPAVKNQTNESKQPEVDNVEDTSPIELTKNESVLDREVQETTKSNDAPSKTTSSIGKKVIIAVVLVVWVIGVKFYVFDSANNEIADAPETVDKHPASASELVAPEITTAKPHSVEIVPLEGSLEDADQTNSVLSMNDDFTIADTASIPNTLVNDTVTADAASKIIDIKDKESTISQDLLTMKTIDTAAPPTISKNNQRTEMLVLSDQDDIDTGLAQTVTNHTNAHSVLDSLNIAASTNEKDISKVRAKGIVRWPITWIDNTKKKQRRSLIGVKNITVLEHEMLAMSKIEVNK